jgi:hypothetical protein
MVANIYCIYVYYSTTLDMFTVLFHIHLTLPYILIPNVFIGHEVNIQNYMSPIMYTN